MLSKLLTLIIGRVNPRIHARHQSIKQARRPVFYKYIDRLLLSVTP